MVSEIAYISDSNGRFITTSHFRWTMWVPWVAFLTYSGELLYYPLRLYICWRLWPMSRNPFYRRM